MVQQQLLLLMLLPDVGVCVVGQEPDLQVDHDSLQTMLLCWEMKLKAHCCQTTVPQLGWHWHKVGLRSALTAGAAAAASLHTLHVPQAAWPAAPETGCCPCLCCLIHIRHMCARICCYCCVHILHFLLP